MFGADLRPPKRPRAAAESTPARIYDKNVVPALTKDFGYKNPMAVPKVEKVSINIGLGEATATAS